MKTTRRKEDRRRPRRESRKKDALSTALRNDLGRALARIDFGKGAAWRRK